MNPNTFPAVISLAGAMFFLGYFILRFARARLLAADVAVLERMRSEGILVGDPLRDYQTLSYLLATIAPAVSLRSELWVSVYGGLLWAMRLATLRTWSDRQLRMLAAHQAERYQTAISRLAELQAT